MGQARPHRLAPPLRLVAPPRGRRDPRRARGAPRPARRPVCPFGHDTGRSPPRRTPAARERARDSRGDLRHELAPLPRHDRAGPSLRDAASPKEPDIRARGDADAGARHRRQRGGVPTRERAASPLASRGQAVRAGVGGHRSARQGARRPRLCGAIDFHRAVVAGDPLPAAGLLVVVRVGQRGVGSLDRRRSRVRARPLRQWTVLRRARRARARRPPPDRSGR